MYIYIYISPHRSLFLGWLKNHPLWAPGFHQVAVTSSSHILSDQTRRLSEGEMGRSSIFHGDIVVPIGSMYAIYGNMDPINIPPLC